jgi:hypothetical protein
MRSPYAAGLAKAAGKSGDTTPDTRNAKPMNRKQCRRRSGRRASAGGWRRSSGQMYHAVTSPQATKLKAIPVPYNANWDIMGSLTQAMGRIRRPRSRRGELR